MNYIKKTVQLLVVGAQNCGKTSLVYRFIEGKYDPCCIVTVGVDVSIKDMSIDYKDTRIMIFDTNEMFPHRKECDGVIFVFDVNDQRSFDYICSLVNDAKYTGMCKTIVGNKCDQKEAKILDAGKKLANVHNIPFFTTSAKAGLNVDNVFENIVKNVFLQRELYDNKLRKDREDKENERIAYKQLDVFVNDVKKPKYCWCC